MNQKSVWNRVAEGWTHIRIRPVKEVTVFARNKKGNALDIGCGNCRNLLPFRNCELYGIDFSEKMIKEAEKFCKKNKLNVKLKISNAIKLPFGADYFDAVICIAALHSIKNRKKAVKEMFRVMKPKARALVSVWYKKDKGEKFVPWKKRSKTLHRYYYFFEKNELKGLLASVGFNVSRIWISGGIEKNIFAEIVKPL